MRRTSRTHERPDTARGGAIVRVMAWVLIVGGLLLFGVYAWQIWGTNALARSQQTQGQQALKRSWKAGEATASTNGVHLSALVQIPKLGTRAVPMVEGTGDKELAQGFGHFEHSAPPGGKGNFALAAHRVTHGEPLRGMPSLRPGDLVLVETKSTIYTYELDTAGAALRVDFGAGWVLEFPPKNPDAKGTQPPRTPRLLTLTTCAELFHTDDRLVAFGHLVSKFEKGT